MRFSRFSDKVLDRMSVFIVSGPLTASFAALPGEMSVRCLKKRSMLGANDFYFGGCVDVFNLRIIVSVVMHGPRFSKKILDRISVFIAGGPPTTNFAALPGEMSVRHLKKRSMFGANDFHFGICVDIFNLRIIVSPFVRGHRFSNKILDRMSVFVAGGPMAASFAPFPGDMSVRTLPKRSVIGTNDFHFGS